jgi:catechol 2,3-dioxygenase-like lactoylglutathione lyase family enzyme
MTGSVEEEAIFKATKAFSGFSVNDLAAAKAFYARTLGLAVEEHPAGLTLKIVGGNGTLVDPKNNHIPATFTIFNFPVATIDQAVDELRERGVTFEPYADLTDERGIARASAAGQGPGIAWFKDPAGNILSVLQAP